MTPTLSLPASVRDRSCFTQYMGGLAIDPMFFDQAVHTIEKMGMTKIWEINEKQPPSVFSRSIWALAASMRMAGIEAELPESYKEQAKAAPAAGSKEVEVTDEWGSPPYVISKGTAIIPVNGPLSKQASSLEGIFGGSSTVGMRKALALALADPQVERVMFHVDSPGGTVSGTGDLGDDIYTASAKKPIASFVEDMGTSAAYWIASQTAHVYASQYANVGSIGVIWTVYDTSEAYQKEGIKVRAITSSPGKAFVVDGMPITDKQVAKMQAYVDATYQAFVSVVARGRGVDVKAARTMGGDADIYNAPLALEKGLVDAVMPFAEALADFSANGKKMVRKEARIEAVVRTKQSTPPVAAAVSDTGMQDSNTPVHMMPPEESSVTPEPESAGQPAKATPVTMSADEHKVLKAQAEQGAEALKIVKDLQAKQADEEKAALALERERLVAEYPTISKEATAAMPTMAALRALENQAKAAGVRRTPADPQGTVRSTQTAEETNKAEAEAWQKDLDARAKSLLEHGNLSEVNRE